MPVTTAFFTTEDSLVARFDVLGRQLGLRADSTDELRIWQRGVGRATAAHGRPGYDARGPLDPVITERVACATGYNCETRYCSRQSLG